MRRSAVLLAWFAAACAEPNSPGDRVTMQDSAGIQIVTTLRAEWDSVVMLDQDPIAVIETDQPGVPPVGRILNAAILANGTIALVDDWSYNVRLYAADGRHLRVVGGQGDGPGEFRAPRTAQPLDDGGFVVFDVVQRRLTAYDSLGEMHGETSLGLVDQAPGYAWSFGRDVVVTWEREDVLDSMPVRATSESGRLLAPMGALRGVDMTRGTAATLLRAQDSDLVQSPTGVGIPWFGARPWMATTSDQLIFAGSRSHAIHWIDPIDGMHSVVRFPSKDELFDPSEIEQLLSEHLAIAAAAGTTPGRPHLYDPRLQPETKTAVGRVAVGPDGTVWAKVFEPSTRYASKWWIVTVRDGFRGLVQLPDRTDVMAITDEHLLLRRRDELDVERLELWAMPEQVRQP